MTPRRTELRDGRAFVVPVLPPVAPPSNRSQKTHYKMIDVGKPGNPIPDLGLDDTPTARPAKVSVRLLVSSVGQRNAQCRRWAYASPQAARAFT